MPVLDRKWWTLVAVCTATFMLLLDITVVNVALPAIQRSLHSSFSDLQWVVDAYSLTLAAFLLTAGVLGDMFGRRAIFAIGLVIFTASSLVCGLASSSTMLNLSRAIQGVGGAVMFATSVALIASAFHGRTRHRLRDLRRRPRRRGRHRTTHRWGADQLGRMAVDLLRERAGRRSGCRHHLGQSGRVPRGNTRRIDWLGFASLSGALFMLVLALVRGNYDGWRSPLILGLFVGSAALLVVFLLAEWRGLTPCSTSPCSAGRPCAGCRWSPSPSPPPSSPSSSTSPSTSRTISATAPWPAGVRFLPITMMAFVVAPVAGKLTVRLHSRYLLGTGLLLVTGGLLLMGTTRPTSGWTQLLAGFLVAGVGIGMVNPVLASASVSVVPYQRSGMASGANSTFRQIGIATGIAALGAVFASEIQSKTFAVLHTSAAGQLVVQKGGTRLGLALQAGGVGRHSPPSPCRPPVTRCSMPIASPFRARSTS